MSTRFRIILMLFASILLSASFTFSQDDFDINIRKSIKEAEKQKALRTG